MDFFRLLPLFLVFISPSFSRPVIESNATSRECGRRASKYEAGLRIVGGEPANFGMFPWQISLRQRSIYKYNNFFHKCGASLLNERWAITAAHCVDKTQDPSENLQLRLGETDYADDNEDLPYVDVVVDIAAIHPLYDTANYDYDLALLRFRQPVEFKDNIIPICLPSPSDINYYRPNRKPTVTGWGRMEEDAKKLPDKLQMVSVELINNTECEKMYSRAKFNVKISNVALCAGFAEGGKDSCQGDSGGPMVLLDMDTNIWSLAGVVSWGIGCAEPNQPGVYVRVTEVRKWIEDIISL